MMEVDPARSVIPRNITPNNVVDTAQNWIKKCNCAKSWEQPGEKWYPRRLLDLEDLRNNSGDLLKAKVRLIESKDCLGPQAAASRGRRITSNRENDRYVSLSHCWGKPTSGLVPLQLTLETERQFKNEGIMLQELPRTFRDAVLFASQLDKVGFIWIDSLCIRQPIWGPGANEKEQLKDWFEQSRYMGTIYQKAFLNISATASSDGNGGLLFDRCPEQAWENDVNVYYPNNDNDIGVPKKAPTRELHSYTKCAVVDVSAWEDLVELAPVNRRGWVFQERLLAPRVLHFCRDQIAWECHEFQTAEGHTQTQLAVNSYRGNIGQEGRLKHLTVSAGRMFREARLQGMQDPDQHLQHLYIYELWKKVVEMYSRTQLTMFKDKLIALAGIARLFQEDFLSSDSKCNYVAGLWSRHLESQLLWHVNEVYEGDGIFDNPAQRHAEGGPSFSWAAIASPHGITYGDVTDYVSPTDGKPKPTRDLLFRAVDYRTTLADPKNPFGMVAGGKLLLAPQYLQRIDMYKLPAARRVPFGWRLKVEPQPKRPKEYTNIYLDAPKSDTDIFGQNAHMYCMPAAYGERTVSRDDRYLYCLLLKYEGTVSFSTSVHPQNEGQYRAFRRVGITKLSSMDRVGQAAVMEVATHELICIC
jgi:hypothetical protein